MLENLKGEDFLPNISQGTMCCQEDLGKIPNWMNCIPYESSGLEKKSQQHFFEIVYFTPQAFMDILGAPLFEKSPNDLLLAFEVNHEASLNCPFFVF